MTQMLVGKHKGQLINWMAGEVSNNITDAIQSGSKKLNKIKKARDRKHGEKRREIVDKAIDAEDAFHNASV